MNKLTELTPEAVAKHAESCPVPGAMSRGKPVPLAMWRFVSANKAQQPRLAGCWVDANGNITVRTSPGCFRYHAARWDGAWTPVRPDGSDLPDPQADELRRLASWYEARWQEAKDLLGITGPKMGPQDVLGQIEILLESVDELEASKPPDKTDDGLALVTAIELAHERERAAIAKGVESLAEAARQEAAESWERQEVSGELDDRAEDLEGLAARLKAGEWSVKP